MPVLCTVLCCVFNATAAAADAPLKELSLTISGGAVPAAQRVLHVDKGDRVRLSVASDAPGEIHLHGYRLQTKVVPGSPSGLSFSARATGRYRLEWHPSGEAEKTGNHRGPPLATLEVRPK